MDGSIGDWIVAYLIFLGVICAAIGSAITLFFIYVVPYFWHHLHWVR